MPTVQYMAKVKEGRLLELPEQAEALGLKPGDEIIVTLEQNGEEKTTAFPPNEKGLAIMRKIAELQKDMPYSDGSNSLKLLHEARAGAMYGYDPTE